MRCPSCGYAITPGMELSVGTDLQCTCHCPYCLAIIEASADEAVDDPEAGQESLSVKRFTARREVRARFVQRLCDGAPDGRPICPICGEFLSKSDQIQLLSASHAQCGYCQHDLAHVAYRKEAFHEQRWLPVLYALADLKADETCSGCRFFGAMAQACKQALSWMPRASSKHGRLVVSALARCDWTIPENACWSTCGAIEQYRRLAGEGLSLL